MNTVRLPAPHLFFTSHLIKALCNVLLLATALFAGIMTAAAAAKPGSVKGVGSADDPTRQTDADWVDDRWQKTEVGQFLGATIETPGRKTCKGIAIKLGDHDEAAVCFDTDLMRYSAGWTGRFLEISPRRYGLINAPKPDGAIRFTTSPAPGWARNGSFGDPRATIYGPLPREWAKYRGLYLSGQRVVLAYSVGSAGVLESPWIEKADGVVAFTRTIELPASAAPLLLRVCDHSGSTARLETISGQPMVLLEALGGLLAVALTGTGGELLAGTNADAQIRVAAASGPVHLKTFTWRGAKTDLPKFAALVKASPLPLPLKTLTNGGPPRWTTPVVTKGVVGRDAGPFVIDTLTVPYENPWRALMFTSGHDFFDNGDAAVCTAHGDVWRVSGVEDKLEKLTWKRFATGLYQPLGLKIVGNRVHVLERDQITVLHDLNGDGEADFHENFNNDCVSAGGGHSYAACLETDADGNFYFVKCAEDTPHGGAVLRVTKDGSRLDVVATGFRNPNGMGVSPRGAITVADQQGEWVPETRLDVIKPGGFYGYMPMHKRATKPATYDDPLCWIARSVDNSAGGETWVPEKLWGPLAGQMIHLSYGRCTMMAVLRDEANGGAQGMVVPLPGRFQSGVMRARFHPRDGHLYVSGLRGWQTAALRDGCLQRVRYTGTPLYLPVAYAVHTNGLRLTFSEPLERQFAESADSFGVSQWNYRWTAKYGSPEFSVTDPEKEGRDEVPVKSAKLSADNRSVFLEIPSLKRVMEMEIKYNLTARDGKTVRGTVYTTINHINAAAKPAF